MTGKEFFGKLLNNRQEDESPWDGEQPHSSSPNGEVDVAESSAEENDHESFDNRPNPDESTYVDAPVSELSAPDAEAVDAPHRNGIYRHPQGADDSFEDARRRNEQPRPSTDEAPSEAGRYQRPGGDGLNTDIPHVSPSTFEEHDAADQHQERNSVNDYHSVSGSQPVQEDVHQHEHSNGQQTGDRVTDGQGAHHTPNVSAPEPVVNGLSQNGAGRAEHSPTDHRTPTTRQSDSSSVGSAAPQNGRADHHETARQPSTSRDKAPEAYDAHSQFDVEESERPVRPPQPDPPVQPQRPAPIETHLSPENGRAQQDRSIPTHPAPGAPPAPPETSAPEQKAPTPEAQQQHPAPQTERPEQPVQQRQPAPPPPQTPPTRQTPPSPQTPAPQDGPGVQQDQMTPETTQSQDPAPHEEPAQTSVQPEAPTQPADAKGDTESKNKDDEKDGSSSAAKKVTDADVDNIKDRVVQRLLEKNVVSVDQVKNAIADRNKQGLKATLWRILAQQATVDRERVYREAALTYAFVERKIDEGTIDVDFIRQVADVFPEKKRNRLIELHIVPIGYEFEQQTQLLRVVFITHDPSLPVVRELMQDLNLERYELQYASETTVKDLLARAFPKKNEYLERMTDDPLAYDLGTSYEDEKSELIDEDALEAEINRSSLINLFEGALVEAVHRGASDIHIYPNPRRQIEIHFRVDGRLLHWHTEDKIHPESLLAVIKDNTMNVDRFERDMAQDGFIQRKVDDTLIRYRVSILPIASASNNIHAESIVIRVLDDRKVITDLSKLGLLPGALERFDMAIRQPHGMVILTGPTGSGKSTTLVAALHQVVTPEVNVLTVEDPVEYIISGVRQIKLNHKLGLEGALRAILRHDPDVVMVGEMRDRETAELAVKLANTGHLTFSTLHTNDAPSAVSRLYKMGVEPFLIAYAINLVVAQRLLRTLCPKCKIVDNDPDDVLLERLGFTDEELREYTLFKASGDPTCKSCKGMGYKGRRAISEALYFSREIRHMIVEADTKIDEDGLRDLARSQGMLTLQDSAREVVKMGETSVDEMMRVTMTEE